MQLTRKRLIGMPGLSKLEQQGTESFWSRLSRLTTNLDSLSEIFP